MDACVTVTTEISHEEQPKSKRKYPYPRNPLGKPVDPTKHENVMCPQCGKEFSCYKCRPHKFCSKECALAARRAAGEAYVPPNIRRCSRCKAEYPATTEYFHRDKKTKVGLCCWCRTCVQEVGRARQERLHPKQGGEQLQGGMKRCTKCRELFPAVPEFFTMNNGSKDGLAFQCRPCQNEFYRLKREANREELNAYSREYRTKALERRREIERASQAKPGVKARRQMWEAENKDLLHLISRRYALSHPEIRRAAGNRRRTRLTNAGGYYTAEDVIAQYEAQGGRCYWCLVLLSDRYDADHYMPVAKGGNSDPENIVCSCRLCNQRKGTKLPDVFRQELIDEGILERLDALLTSTLVCAYNIWEDD